MTSNSWLWMSSFFKKKGIFMTNISTDTYDEVIKCVDNLIQLVIDEYLHDKISNIFVAYKKDLNTNQNASIEINEAINESIKKTLSYLSKDYRKKLKMFFSDDGLVFYIYVKLKQSCQLQTK